MNAISKQHFIVSLQMLKVNEDQKIKIRDADYPSDLTAIIDMYTNAFEEEKQFIWAFQTSGETHRKALKFLFEGRLFMMRMFTKNILLVCHDEGMIVGACGIQPNSCESTLYHQIRAGLLLIPIYYGYESLTRLQRLGASSKESVIDETGGVLVMMAIQPKYQGQGVGSKLLIDILNKWDSEGGGNLKLSTQTENNVRFYIRHGFEVTHSIEFIDFTDWTMIRKKKSEEK